MPSSNKRRIAYGAACLPCRDRKLRCDAAPLICSQCVKSQLGLECKYGRSQGNKVERLERKIAELEKALEEIKKDEPTAGPAAIRPLPLSLSESSSSENASAESPVLEAVPIVGIFPPSALVECAPGRGQLPYMLRDCPGLFELDVSDHFPYDLSTKLLDIFFSKCFVSHVFQASSLYASLFLPLKHPDRPHTSVLFAIYALAVSISCDSSLRLLEYPLVQRAKDYLYKALDQDGLFGALQAYWVLSEYYELSSLYMFEAAGLKLSVALGFHRLTPAKLIAAIKRRCYKTNDRTSARWFGLPGTHVTLHRVPETPEEQALSLSLFWGFYYLDRTCCVATYRPTCATHEDDILTALTLPCPLLSDADGGDTAVQTLQDPDCYTRHPQMGSHTFLIKAVSLACRASRLNDSDATDIAHDDPHAMSKIRTSEDFAALDKLLVAFRESLPDCLTGPPRLGRTPCSFDEEARITARFFTALGPLLLHAPHLRTNAVSEAVCDRAAAEIVELISLVLAVPNYDVSRLPCEAHGPWYRAGQHSIRAMRRARRRKLWGEEARLRASATLCISVLMQFGKTWSFTVHHAQLLEQAMRVVP